MGRSKVVDAQAGFADGVNTIADPNFLAPGQARQLSNATLSAYGAAGKRLGTQYVSATELGTAPRRALYWAKNSQVIFGGISTTVYSCGGSVPASASALGGTALTRSRLIDQCVFSDGAVEVMYLLSADALSYPSITVTTLQRTNTGGTSVSAALAGVPTPISGMCVYNNRLWGWNTGKTNSLYYSNLASATGSIGGDSLGISASGGGVIQVTTFGAANIVACQTVGASLLIFHQRGISRLTGFGQDDINVQPQGLTGDVSLMGRQAVDENNGVAWLLTTDGLYTATEGSVQRVGTPQHPDPTIPYLTAASAATAGDPNVLVRFNSATSQVWMLIPAPSAASVLFIYDTVLSAWMGPFTGSVSLPSYGSALSFTEVTDSLNFPHMWMGTFGSGVQVNFLQCNAAGFYLDRVLSDGTGGAAYTSTVQLHRMYGNGVPRSDAKAWRWINLVATLTAGGTAPVVTSTTQLGSSNPQTLSNLVSVSAPYYVQGAGVGPWIDVVITEAGSTAAQYETVGVDGYVLGQR